MEFEWIHFYLEDGARWCGWFCQCLGFQAVARSRNGHTQTDLIRNGAVQVLLSSPLQPESPVARYLQRHPPGVADVAFRVRDLAVAIARSQQAGVKTLQPIHSQAFPQGSWKQAKVAGWGDLSHTLVERPEALAYLTTAHQLLDPALPEDSVDSLPQRGQPSGSQVIATSAIDPTPPQTLTSLTTNDPDPAQSAAVTRQISAIDCIDHVVLNVAAGELELAVAWYERAFGLQRRQAFTIQTERSGLVSQVLAHPEGGVQLPINEPTSPSSQIQEFLDANQGAGIQHIALRSRNILQTVAQFKHQGVSFLPIPSTYYRQLQQRHPHIANSILSASEWQAIQQQQLLLDWSKNAPDALLLQTFTQPIFPQPTVFLEIIERRQQAEGFGEGNFRALFEAIEREQMERGSLASPP